jgi:hypothetical protein
MYDVRAYAWCGEKEERYDVSKDVHWVKMIRKKTWLKACVAIAQSTAEGIV